MFGLKNFMMRKLLESKMKDIPKEEQEMIFNMVEKNPELFQKIAEETQEEMKKGKSQMDAAMSVMKKYEEDLRKLKGN